MTLLIVNLIFFISSGKLKLNLRRGRTYILFMFLLRGFLEFLIVLKQFQRTPVTFILICHIMCRGEEMSRTMDFRK